MITPERLQTLLRLSEQHRCVPQCRVCEDREIYQTLLTQQTKPAMGALDLMVQAVQAKSNGSKEQTQSLADATRFLLTLM